MKSLKHLQENLQWFDITFLSQYYGLDSKREIIQEANGSIAVPILWKE